tara:strand:+ start:142 stop:1209 length:1068 start_codon:yes stop_codon:yes gene_type:complete
MQDIKTITEKIRYLIKEGEWTDKAQKEEDEIEMDFDRDREQEKLDLEKSKTLNSIAQYNLDFLNNNVRHRIEGARYQLREMSFEDLIERIPVFHQQKIVKYLGAGLYGFVVQLDNEHALKIASGEYDALSEKYFLKISKKSFKEVTSPSELFVFDSGEFEARLINPWLNHGRLEEYTWREIPLIISFADLLEEEGRDMPYFSFSEIKGAAFGVFLQGSRRVEQQRRRIEGINDPDKKENLNKIHKIYRSIYRQFLKAKSSEEYLKLFKFYFYVSAFKDFNVELRRENFDNARVNEIAKKDIERLIEAFESIGQESTAGILDALKPLFVEGIVPSDLHHGNLGKAIGSNHWVIFDF